MGDWFGEYQLLSLLFLEILLKIDDRKPHVVIKIILILLLNFRGLKIIIRFPVVKFFYWKVFWEVVTKYPPQSVYFQSWKYTSSICFDKFLFYDIFIYFFLRVPLNVIFPSHLRSASASFLIFWVSTALLVLFIFLSLANCSAQLIPRILKAPRP